MEQNSFIPRHQEVACWVYILQLANTILSIRYTPDLEESILSLPAGALLLFFKPFYTIQEGLAYKLYLENLSRETLKCLINKENPHYKDLKKSLTQQ